MPDKTESETHGDSRHDENATAEKNPSNVQPHTLAATFDALGGPPDPWGRGHLQLYGACLIIYFCSTMNGYDGSLMGSINVLSEYQSYYNLGSSGSSTTGLVFSIFNIGQMAGALFAWTTDLFGRRKTLVATALGVCCSAVFTALAPTLPAFIAARFLVSFFSTICCIAAPMLLVEIAPPLHRASVAGIYNTLYYVGSIIATFTMYGANIHLSGNIKWRLPLWLQILCPGIVCLGSWLLPESPRWQISQGKYEEARTFIIQHHANGDANHPIVAIEMQEIEDSLAQVRARSIWSCFDLRSLFKSRARLYRVMLAMAMGWFGQFSGNNVVSYYLPIMVENVGITSTNMVLLLNAIYAVTGWISATIGARLHDIVGRRKMLMGSCLGMSAALAIVTGTAAAYEQTGSSTSSSASIAFIFVFGVIFAVAFTPMQPIYPAEVLANDMRANGMMVFQITAGCASFVNTFAAPIAMENIKYWFYVFFVFWDLFEFGFIYLFFVETKGRTLEELDAVFDAKNPRKASTRKVDVLVG
ncbi:putative transporter [Aspergillus cavernicola]|uniref:Transporter n=1 Tax=Aspergillus cavernicola TaxID=176166 RepID=A0ABR4IXV4_9EURO